MKYLIIISLLYNSQILAIDVNPEKVCFTKDEELKLRQISMDEEICQIKLRTLNDLSQIDNQIIQEEKNSTDLFKKELVIQQQVLESEKSKTKWQKWLYLIGGVVIGGLAGFTYSQVKK